MAGLSKCNGRLKTLPASTAERPVQKLIQQICLQPKQSKLRKLINSSPATWIGFGGSRGGAKSGGARRIMLARRIENTGTRGAIFRRTYDLVKENHIDKYMSEYPVLERYY